MMNRIFGLLTCCADPRGANNETRRNVARSTIPFCPVGGVERFAEAARIPKISVQVKMRQDKLDHQG
jgi:hypothetical protein